MVCQDEELISYRAIVLCVQSVLLPLQGSRHHPQGWHNIGLVQTVRVCWMLSPDEGLTPESMYPPQALTQTQTPDPMYPAPWGLCTVYDALSLPS